MNQSITNSLAAVINTLNQISVSGKQNLMRLSGCIDVLEQILGEQNKSGKPDTEVSKNGISG